MSDFIHVFIVFSLEDAICFRGDHSLNARFFQYLKNAIPRIIGFVSQKPLNISKKCGQQRISPL